MSDLHSCSLKGFCYGIAGPAILDCTENEDGELWAGNGEYDTQVNFCPACGHKAKVPSPLTSKDKGARG